MSNRYPDEDLNEQLLTVVQHQNPNVRAGAAVALGYLRSPKAVDVLIEMLSDPVYHVHRSAARGIGMVGARSVGTLLAVLQENPGSVVEKRLADAIGFVRDPEAVEILSAAVNYLEPPARYGAIDALGEIGDQRAIPALVQVNRSADAMSRLRSAQALLNLSAPEATLAFAGLLGESDSRIRVLAIRGLGKIGSESAALSLLTMLSDEDEMIRQASAEALREMRAPDMLDVLLTTLNSPSTWVQKTIAEVLGNYPEARVIELLMGLLTHQGDLDTRLAAALSLSLLGDKRGKAMIMRTLNAPNVEIRQAASIALGLSGDPQAIVPFIQTIRKKPIDPGIPRGRILRRKMIAAMTAIGEPAIKPFIELLADKESFVKVFARDLLLNLGESAVDELIAAMKGHRNPSIRIASADLLGQIGDERAVEPLADTLRSVLAGPYPLIFLSRLFIDPNAGLRESAAKALGRIGSHEGTSLLLSAARFDPDKAVKQSAERALARIGSPAGVVRLAQGDITGFINHAMVSGVVILLVGAIAALVSRNWGVQDAALLAGLASGAVFGYVDGLEGRKKSAQGAIIGAISAVFLAWLLSSWREPWMISVAGIGFPALGSLLGWDKVSVFQRIAGLFGGMVLGFAGAGILALILGTIN